MARAVMRGQNVIEDERGSVAWDGRVVIAEGGRDYLSWRWALCPAQGPEGWTAPAVLGVWSGAWSAELAQRIPTDARVTIATDADPAGDRYAAQIAPTLAHLCGAPRRWRPPVAPAPTPETPR